jgi:hypothetical protein
MKHSLLQKFLAVSCALALSGCATPPSKPQTGETSASRTTRDEFVATLNGIGVERAPTLGPVYREFLLAVYDKDYEKAWGFINQSSQDTLTSQLSSQIAELENATQLMEAELRKPDISRGARDYYTRSCAAQRDLAKQFKSFNGDGKQYFAFLIEKKQVISVSREIVAQMEVTGETINGDGGSLMRRHKETGEAGAVPFVLENGAWKLDLLKTSQTQKPSE